MLENLKSSKYIGYQLDESSDITHNEIIAIIARI